MFKYSYFAIFDPEKKFVVLTQNDVPSGTREMIWCDSVLWQLQTGVWKERKGVTAWQFWSRRRRDFKKISGAIVRQIHQHWAKTCVRPGCHRFSCFKRLKLCVRLPGNTVCSLLRCIKDNKQKPLRAATINHRETQLKARRVKESRELHEFNLADSETPRITSYQQLSVVLNSAWAVPFFYFCTGVLWWRQLAEVFQVIHFSPICSDRPTVKW